MSHFFQDSRFKIQDSYRGFTLIESLVFLFLFAIISLVFFQTYTVGTRLIIESKNRLGATALANQKMEIIRSIEYDSIGTTSGIPAGDLAENETISVNTTKYEVHTFVQYVDDAFDSTVTGTDIIPTDYKRVRITVSWGNLGSDQSVAVFGNFSPNGVESSSGGGVLSINVLDGGGSGITGVGVHIVNSAAGVNVTGNTDSTGNLTLPGAPAGTEAYTITVSKSGYYGATTYPAYPTSAYNPVDVHASVAADVLNQKTLVINQSSDITLTTKDPFGTVIPNIDYTLSGGRILGTNPNTGVDVSGFSDTGTTNGSGQASYPGESAGDYVVTATGTGYEFFKLSPENLVINEFSAVAGNAASVDVIMLDENIGSIKVAVTNQADGTPLSGASVHVTNALLAYDATVTTDQYGYAYFPTGLPELADETYDITVSLAGYDDESDTVTITGTLQNKSMALTAN